MSVPAVDQSHFDHIDKEVQNGNREEVMNWIVSHEAIAQTILFEYYHKHH